MSVPLHVLMSVLLVESLEVVYVQGSIRGKLQHLEDTALAKVTS